MFHLVIETQFCDCVSMTYQLYINVSMIQRIDNKQTPINDFIQKDQEKRWGTKIFTIFDT